MSWACSRHGGYIYIYIYIYIYAFKIVVRKSGGKRPLGRSRRRWMDNIEIDLKYNVMMCTGVMWLRIGYRGELLWKW
jgi:hypothetical protein